jgi:hypothetical protein
MTASPLAGRRNKDDGSDKGHEPEGVSAPIGPGGSRDVAGGAVRGHDLWSMTREVLEALGGIGRIVNPGETVFIKPNMVTLPWAGSGRNPFARGECTKAEIAAATAEACLEAGAREVIIGDGSQMPRFEWERATTLDGATNLAAEAARLRAAHPGTCGWPAWRWIRRAGWRCRRASHWAG